MEFHIMNLFSSQIYRMFFITEFFQQMAKLYNFSLIVTKYGLYEGLYLEIFVWGVKAQENINYGIDINIQIFLYAGIQKGHH